MTVVVRTREELAKALADLPAPRGVVMTMGALHDGHAELMRKARAECASLVATLFVNPLQFGAGEDLDKYPRTFEADLAICEQSGVDVLFAPGEPELYPNGRPATIVTAGPIANILEGASRPGHFDGVLTVVMKLLQVAQPYRAYFGEKDWQQLSLVRGMAEAFFLPVTIVACPTVRDADGLALSSRNRTLPPADRQRAPRFHQVLSSAPTPADAERELREAGFVVDYVAEHEGRRLGAVRIGGVRLIDNLPAADGR
jgi:pantoate--beta-alanine ligase